MDPVEGSPEFASSARSHYGHCKTEGRHWEQKEPIFKNGFPPVLGYILLGLAFAIIIVIMA